MQCQSCGSRSTQQILSQSNPRGVYEEFRCSFCQHVTCTINGIPLVIQSVATWAKGVGVTSTPISLPAKQFVHPYLTQDEKIKEFWNQEKAIIDALPELDQLAMYFYLNKSGVNMSGIEQRIEKLLAAKFPKEEAKK